MLGNTATAGLNQTGVFSIREDTEVLWNGPRNTSTGFGIREDTEVLNKTSNTDTGAYVAFNDSYCPPELMAHVCAVHTRFECSYLMSACFGAHVTFLLCMNDPCHPEP